MTPKAIEALKLLVGTHAYDTRSAKALARTLWPDKMRDCHTSLRRGGLYRSAGAYYSKLQKQGLVGHYMDDMSSGYYLTKEGAAVLAAVPIGIPAGNNL